MTGENITTIISALAPIIVAYLQLKKPKGKEQEMSEGEKSCVDNSNFPEGLKVIATCFIIYSVGGFLTYGLLLLPSIGIGSSNSWRMVNLIWLTCFGSIIWVLVNQFYSLSKNR